MLGAQFFATVRTLAERPQRRTKIGKGDGWDYSHLWHPIESTARSGELREYPVTF